MQICFSHIAFFYFVYHWFRSSGGRSIYRCPRSSSSSSSSHHQLKETVYAFCCCCCWRRPVMKKSASSYAYVSFYNSFPADSLSATIWTFCLLCVFSSHTRCGTKSDGWNLPATGLSSVYLYLSSCTTIYYIRRLSVHLLPVQGFYVVFLLLLSCRVFWC